MRRDDFDGPEAFMILVTSVWVLIFGIDNIIRMSHVKNELRAIRAENQELRDQFSKMALLNDRYVRDIKDRVDEFARKVGQNPVRD